MTCGHGGFVGSINNGADAGRASGTVSSLGASTFSLGSNTNNAPYVFGSVNPNTNNSRSSSTFKVSLPASGNILSKPKNVQEGIVHYYPGKMRKIYSNRRWWSCECLRKDNAQQVGGHFFQDEDVSRKT